MKPFNLEAAKRGEPIVTRTGVSVQFIAYVPEARHSERIVILCSYGVRVRCESGKTMEGIENNGDLFMAPKKRTVWVNFFEPSMACFYYASEGLADAGYESCKRIGGRAYPVEIEE